MFGINANFMQTVQDSSAQAVHKLGDWFAILRLKIVDMMQKLDLTPTKIIEICSYLGVGFFIGFLFKRYFKIVLVFVVAYLGLIWFLGEFDLILINWTHVQSMAHITPNDTVSTVLASTACWVRQNIVIVVSSLVGFIAGYRIG